MWQDIVLMIGSFVCSAALMPTILSDTKPHAGTSTITAIVLIVFCICFATLGLWLTMIANAIACIAWVILLVQKLSRISKIA
jgi:hypothetical protein